MFFVVFFAPWYYVIFLVTSYTYMYGLILTIFQTKGKFNLDFDFIKPFS